MIPMPCRFIRGTAAANLPSARRRQHIVYSLVSLLGGAFAVGSRCLSAICCCCEASWWPSLELCPQRLARKDVDARLPSMMNISTGQRALPVLHRGINSEQDLEHIWVSNFAYSTLLSV